LDDIMDAEVTPDLLCIGRFTLLGKSCVSRDDKAPRKAGKIGGQIVGDAVGEVFLLRVVRQIAKGKTTSDSGGAALASGVGEFCAVAVAGAWTTAVEFPLGDIHQSATPMETTAAKPPAITASREMLRARTAWDCSGFATSGSAVIADALI